MDFAAWLRIDIKQKGKPSEPAARAMQALAEDARIESSLAAQLPAQWQRAYARIAPLAADRSIRFKAAEPGKAKFGVDYEMNLLGYLQLESLVALWAELGLGEVTAKLDIEDEDGASKLAFKWVDGALQGTGEQLLQRKELMAARLLEPYWSDLAPNCTAPGGKPHLYLDVFPSKRAEKFFAGGDLGADSLLSRSPLAGMAPVQAIALSGPSCRYAYRFDLGLRETDPEADRIPLIQAWIPWLNKNFEGGKARAVQLLLFRYRYAEPPRHPDSGAALDIVTPWSLKTDIARSSHNSTPRLVMQADDQTLYSPGFQPVALPQACPRSLPLEDALVRQLIECAAMPLQAQLHEHYAAARFRNRHGNEERDILRWDVPRSLPPLQPTPEQREAMRYSERTDSMRVEQLDGLVDGHGQPFPYGAALGIRRGYLSSLSIFSERETEWRRDDR